MDTNEIITNEEVTLVTEDIAAAGSGNCFKVAAGIGLAILVGVTAYKYIAKPIMAKIKAAKNRPQVNEVTKDCQDVEFEDVDEDN